MICPQRRARRRSFGDALSATLFRLSKSVRTEAGWHVGPMGFSFSFLVGLPESDTRCISVFSLENHTRSLFSCLHLQLCASLSSLLLSPVRVHTCLPRMWRHFTKTSTLTQSKTQSDKHVGTPREAQYPSHCFLFRQPLRLTCVAYTSPALARADFRQDSAGSPSRAPLRIPL